MFGKILEKATYLKAKITRDELEIALAQATTEDNWQASTTVLHEIASSAYDHEKWKRISDFIWDKMKNSHNWKKILKCLNIVEFLLKNGPEFACQELKFRVTFFQTLESFREYQGSQDRGASIRERAKSVVQLLQNDQFLQDERLRAHQIREKMSHITGGSTNLSSEYGNKSGGYVPKYESYNSETFSKSRDTGGYYNYGGGNYGDRYEDKKFDHDYFQNAYRHQQPSSEKPRSNPNIPDHQPPPMEVNRPPPVIVQAIKKSPVKPKFSSITESLMKKGTKPRTQDLPTKNQGGIVKPDLSYKRKQPGEYDKEEAFMENRYHFEIQQPQTQARTEVKNVEPPKAQYHNSAPVPQTQTHNQPNLLGDLDSIDFFGKPSYKQQTPVQSVQTQQSQPPKQTTQYPAQQYQAPQQTNQPQPLQQVPQFNQLAQSAKSPHTPYNPNQPLPYGTYNQFNTFNSYGPNYYNPNPSVYGHQPPQFQGYPGYPQPQYAMPPHQPPQPRVNPYVNYQQNTNQISLEGTTFGSADTPAENKPKNSGSQGGMGNLTDLSDIMSDINETKKQAPKQKKTQGTHFLFQSSQITQNSIHGPGE